MSRAGGQQEKGTTPGVLEMPDRKHGSAMSALSPIRHRLVPSPFHAIDSWSEAPSSVRPS